MFGELIIAVVYLPILALEGTEGKLFRPMALTVLFALAGSLVLSLTLMPVLASMLLPRNLHEKDVFLVRLIKRIYHPIVARVVTASRDHAQCRAGPGRHQHSRGFASGCRVHAATGRRRYVDRSRAVAKCVVGGCGHVGRPKLRRYSRKFPEVRTVFCKTGRPEIANDVMGVHQSDVWVMLHPPAQWPRAEDA